MLEIEETSPYAVANLEPPFYLLKAQQTCYACGDLNTVVALSNGKEPDCVLSDIDTLDPVLLSEIRGYNPSYDLRESKTRGTSYYANYCKKCGSIYGEHYLMNTGAFSFLFYSNDPSIDLFQLRYGGTIIGAGGITCVELLDVKGMKFHPLV